MTQFTLYQINLIMCQQPKPSSPQQPDWKPSANLEALKKRAQVLAQIRQFFAQRNVMEVDTPALSQASITDPHLFSFATPYADKNQTLYLQTSPEFHMKRLLCAGSGAIYQICKAFRDEESGRFHNPEFTILEWYRPNFDHYQLMDEVDQLMQLILQSQPAQQLTYAQACIKYLQCDPHNVSLHTLQQKAMQLDIGDWVLNEQDKDTLLQLLFSMQVEPNIGQQRPCFIHQFPASQAALAQLDPDEPRVAQRFELYYRGIELVNGFHELRDSKEQQQRFEQDNIKRKQLKRQAGKIDQRLLNALQAGLPDCSGVALGVDRLIMLAQQCEHIDEVIAFPVARA